MRVSICILTFRRKEGLTRLVRSVFKQRGLMEYDVELIVIDNSPEGTALALLHRIESASPIPMRYAHERRAGVSFARNAALRLANGDLIAWLDDDQEASPLWLDRMMTAHARLKTDILFGPISAKAPEVEGRAYFEQLHTRSGPKEDAILTAPLGIGNSLMRCAALPKWRAPFDERTNETGGEADFLLADAAARGATFGWAAGARVIAHVPAESATLRHAMMRAFAYGQAPCEAAAKRGESLSLARHMTIGAAQALWYGLSAGIAWLFRAPSRLALLDHAARGAGKVFWFRQQNHYGGRAGSILQ